MTRIALLQMCSGLDPLENATIIADGIAKAASGGAATLFTPEMSGLIDRDRMRAASSITDVERDPVLAAVRAAAAEQGIWVSLGSLALRGEKQGKLINCSLMIDSGGTVRARYNKIHLFDVDLANGESWRESSAYAPGTDAMIATTPSGQVGLSVCYDLRFPALYQALSAAGAEILSIPAAFTVPTGSAHWHILMRARAIENACWVVAAAQSGHHADGRKTYGHSLVVDPWGEVTLDMGEGEGLGFAEIDLARVADARSHVPVIAHRRAIPNPVVFP
jgi:deaminated glutathione amidase